jgi:hypothetical protein
MDLSGTIVNGDAGVVTGIDAISQDVTRRLRFILGEWFLNTSAGFPWLDPVNTNSSRRSILGQKVTVASPRLNSALRQCILGTAGIVAFTKDLVYTYTAKTRTMSVTFQANTVLGTLNYSEEIIAP